jgi:hypothetical protein
MGELNADRADMRIAAISIRKMKLRNEHIERIASGNV